MKLLSLAELWTELVPEHCAWIGTYLRGLVGRLWASRERGHLLGSAKHCFLFPSLSALQRCNTSVCSDNAQEAERNFTPIPHHLVGQGSSIIMTRGLGHLGAGLRKGGKKSNLSVPYSNQDFPKGVVSYMCVPPEEAHPDPSPCVCSLIWKPALCR